MPVTIYHDNRCSKSRNALNILEEKGISYKVRLYFQDLLSEAELKALLRKLVIHPSGLLRKSEEIYKALNTTQHTEAEWLAAMIQHPQLIERPIVVNGDEAIIARPPERVLEILD